MKKDGQEPPSNTFKKPKIHEPKTVEEWKVWLQQQSGFEGIERKLKSSDAYLELCKNPKHALVFNAALYQIRYEKRKKGDNRRRLANEGRVCLPDNLLRVYHINSPATRAAARVRMVELGLLDVDESGHGVFSATKFSLSERWRHFCIGRWKIAAGGGRKVRHRCHE